MRKKYPLMARPRQGPGYVYQGSENDRLFDSDYEHPGEKRTCHECDDSRQLERPERDDLDPYIFYGTIASGNQVIKDARKRDLFSQCLCFETEAAGLMNDFPCLVIRGICDYCDSHKNNQWQRYAAATAAAYAKELMQVTDVQDVQNASEARGIVDEVREIRATLQKNEERLSESESRRRREMLHATDPVLDKKRIEEAKGGLLEGSYRWVLNNTEFRKWRTADNNQFLWIKGSPGKGKTMLICGIVDELLEEAGDVSNVAYFFCQARDNRINNATAVLRGLIYMLVKQQSSLINHIPDDLPENENAWTQVRGVFLDILSDEALTRTHLIIDALDECTTGLDKLLRFLEELSTSHPHVKWLVSSRDWQSIRESLNVVTHAEIDLDLVDGSLSHAVQFFIEHKVKELCERKAYSEDQRNRVQNHLELNANGTFLWVALVCKQLHEAPRRHLERYLHTIPSDLDGIYHRMLSNIDELKDHGDAKLCISLLGIVTTVYRPITLDEMPSLLDMEEDIGDDFDEKDLREIVVLCGSFLSLQNRTITLVHQSAQEFLQRRVSQKIYPGGEYKTHYSIFSRSLIVLASKLERDICRLGEPAISISEVHLKLPNPNPLAAIEYAGIHWVDHLEEYFKQTDANARRGEVEKFHGISLISDFLCNQLLHWFEALSLLRSLSEGATSLLKLEILLKEMHVAKDSDLIVRIEDAYRFIVYHKMVIEQHPLQVYISAMLFTPHEAITRKQFESDELPWLKTNEFVEEVWGQCLQTFNHRSHVNSVAFSSSSTRLASGDSAGIVMIWDTRNGRCLQTLQVEDRVSYPVTSLVFSPDDKWLASASSGALMVWKTSSWHCLHSLELHSRHKNSVAVSPNGKFLALGGESIRVWETNEWQCLYILEGNSGYDTPLAFSPDGMLLASGEGPASTKIWDTKRWQCLQTLEDDCRVRLVKFSPNGKWLVCGSTLAERNKRSIRIWDVECWQSILNFVPKSRPTSAVFSNGGTKLVFGFLDGDIQVWDADGWRCLYTIRSLTPGPVQSVTISQDDTQFASGSFDGSVKIWNLHSPSCLIDNDTQILDSRAVEFSPDGTVFVMGGLDGIIKIWDAHTVKCLKSVEGQCNPISLVEFSPNGEILLSFDLGLLKFEVWESNRWQCLKTIEYEGKPARRIAFSPHGTLLVSSHSDGSLRVWNTETWKCLQILEIAEKKLEHIYFWDTSFMAFSSDATLFASVIDSPRYVIKIWDTQSWQCLKTLDANPSPRYSLSFLPNNTLLTLSLSKLNSSNGTIKVCDALSRQCVRTLEGYGNHIVRLDLTQSFIQTNRGIFKLPLFDPERSQTRIEHRHGRGFGVSDGRTWITWNSANLLKLPSVYKPSGFAMSKDGSSIGIGCHSGHVILLHANRE